MEETEGKTGPCSDGWNCLPSLLFELKPKYSGGNKDNADFLQKISCVHCCTQCPGPAAGHCRHTPPLETPGHSEASLGQSFVWSLLLSPGSWCVHGSVCALQESVSPVLCKSWCSQFSRSVWEVWEHVCTVLYFEWIINRALLYSTGNSS